VLSTAPSLWALQSLRVLPNLWFSLLILRNAPLQLLEVSRLYQRHFMSRSANASANDNFGVVVELERRSTCSAEAADNSRCCSAPTCDAVNQRRRNPVSDSCSLLGDDSSNHRRAVVQSQCKQPTSLTQYVGTRKTLLYCPYLRNNQEGNAQ
jgi:hypothetical protein